LIAACAFNACPRPYIGRPMKAGKEEIIGLMAAVRWYLGLDHARLMQTYEDQVSWVITAFAGVKQVTARRSFPSEAGQPMPRAELILDQQALGIGDLRAERHLHQSANTAARARKDHRRKTQNDPGCGLNFIDQWRFVFSPTNQTPCAPCSASG
jgi:seryl-tRNA(Sec) selenium transferase